MSEFLVPAHVARAARAMAARKENTPASMGIAMPTMEPNDDAVAIYGLDDPLPEVVPSRVHPYRMYIMPVGMRTSWAGGKLVAAQEYTDALRYNHCLGRIVALGPCCFKGHRWEDIGYTLDMAPKVGDYITFNPRAPIRETWCNIQLLIMNDDDWRSAPTREEINHLKAGF
jgi:hypothetical protein